MPNTCTLAPADYAQAIASQVSTLKQETLPAYVAQFEPYTNVLSAGTTPNNQGEEIITLVADPVVPNQSLTEPSFADTVDSCGTTGAAAQFGQTKYTTKLGTLRGRGPVICLNQARHAVKQSYEMSVEGLKDTLRAIIGADARNQMLNLSGVKAVLKASATTVDATLTGGYNQVQVAFLGGVPTAPISHKYLKALSDVMRYELDGQEFGNGGDGHYVFLGSGEAVEKLRNEAGPIADLRATVSGGFSDTKKALERYAFIEYNYRGIKLGIDKQPLRFNTVTAAGYPIFLAPKTSTVSDYGVKNQTSSAWKYAQYEVGFLIAKDAFKKLVPERFVGEGGMKFDPQFVTGELNWFYPKDSCNEYGDFGWHNYQIIRAFQAIRPYNVIPILYKRCAQDLGLNVCTDFNTSSIA